MKKQFFSIFILSFVIILIFTGCGKSIKNINEPNKDKKFRIGIVTNKTGIDDQSFNQATWEGIKEIGTKNGWKENKNYKYIVSTSSKDFIPNLKKFSSKGYDLTIGVGYPFIDSLGKVAAQNKDADFAIIDGIVEKPNVASITFKEEEVSFLVGVAAALKTKSRKIGFIGGVKTDIIEKFEYGFQAGIQSIDPGIKVISKYANAFDKPELGTSLAASIYDKGADVIFQAAGATGNGVFTEAKNRKRIGKQVWVIGVDRDQYGEGLPENVTLTSAVKHIDTALKKVINNTKKENFPGGKIYRFGIKEHGVGLPKENKNLTEKELKQINLYKDTIRSGTIVVPKTAKDLQKFVPTKPQPKPKLKTKPKQ
jgi:basic membrane protein A